jgi:hypothetical protein
MTHPLEEVGRLMTALSTEEAGRVEALKEAAEILRANGTEEVSTVDMINLAIFIIFGIDPHDARIRREPTFPDAAEWNPSVEPAGD